jgi:hypothetical protein
MQGQRRQEYVDEMHTEAQEKGWPTYRVTISLPDGQSDVEVVEAADEWTARTKAMMLTNVRANGQTASYKVEPLMERA